MLLSTGSNSDNQLSLPDHFETDVNTFTVTAGLPSDFTPDDIVIGANFSVAVFKDHLWLTGQLSEERSDLFNQEIPCRLLKDVLPLSFFSNTSIPSTVDNTRIHPSSLTSPAPIIIKIAASWQSLLILTHNSVICLGPKKQTLFPDYTHETDSDPSFSCHVKPLPSPAGHLISASPRHAAVLLQDRSIFLWGSNRRGQLGIDPSPGHTSSHSTLPGKILAVSCGMTFTAILLQENDNYDRRVTIWGNTKNPSGTSKSVAAIQNPSDVVATWSGIYILSTNKHSFSDPSGKVHTLPAAVKEWSAGAEHVIMLLQDSTVWSHGWNEHGNLGLAHNNDTGDISLVNKLPINFVPQRVWAGLGTSWVSN